MNIAILASGRGSNAKALLEAAQSGELGNVKINLLISDNAQAAALDIAAGFGVEALCIPTSQKGARFTAEATLKYLETLENHNAEFVVLAGFMKIVPDEMIAKYDGRMINLHPSLLPAYKGKDAIKRAYDANEKQCGCSVHYVSSELDGGRIIAQSRVEIRPNESLEEVEQNVHKAEHKLLVEVVKKLVGQLSKKI